MTGEIIVAFNNDKFINKLTPTPIIKQKINKGMKSLLLGILKRQKGMRHKKTIPIRKEDINIGGTD